MSIGSADDLARRAAEMRAEAIRQQAAAANIRASWGAPQAMIGDSYAAESRWGYTWRRVSPINVLFFIFFFVWYGTWTVGRIVWYMLSARWTHDCKERVRRVTLFTLVGLPLIAYGLAHAFAAIGHLFG